MWLYTRKNYIFAMSYSYSYSIVPVTSVFKLFIFLALLPLYTTGVDPTTTKEEFWVQEKQKNENSGCKKAEDLACPLAEVNFWLYTRKYQHNPIKLDQFNLDSIKDAPFDKDAPLKVIVHGYSVNKDTSATINLIPAYLCHGHYNLVAVDWSPLCLDPCYYQAALNVPTVARCVAQFFSALVECRHFHSAHLIGHSQGAHLAAQASTWIPDLRRLTELDPAFPLYEDDSPFLVKGKAELVDVYHSNCKYYGRRPPSGDVDVYFNNESFQPGCTCGNLSCSHYRAVLYYAEGIGSPDKMAAFRCGGWQDYIQDKCAVPHRWALTRVGEYISQNTRGTHLMFTTDESPFLVDPVRYAHPETFKAFRTTADNCFNDTNLVACNFNIYCLIPAGLA